MFSSSSIKNDHMLTGKLCKKLKVGVLFWTYNKLKVNKNSKYLAPVERGIADSTGVFCLEFGQDIQLFLHTT